MRSIRAISERTEPEMHIHTYEERMLHVFRKGNQGGRLCLSVEKKSLGRFGCSALPVAAAPVVALAVVASGAAALGAS